MHSCNSSNDGKPKSMIRIAPLACRINTVEAIEQSGQMLFANRGTYITQ